MESLCYNEGVLIIWSKKCLVGSRDRWSIPGQLELKAAKEILVELFDIRSNEVDEMKWQRMEERALYGREYNLCNNHYIS
ncbi:MAG: hypothetical protein LUQ22_05230 [Methanotrichaceae archaeon]|nr:hypothetical protein [Methanotrichaceae archaeon]